MKRRSALFLVAAAALACSKGPATVGARLGAPAAIAAFAGVTHKGPGLRDYLAVASSRGDELILIDPSDDQPVLGPGVVFPLSVLTEPHPLHVAAASLGDRGAGGADVLAAVSAGSLDLQVVETWTPFNRISPAASVSLASVLGPDAEILTLTGMTAPGAGPASPRARILAGATGGRMVVVEFTRDASTGAVVPGTPVLQTLGFDPADVALDPGGTRLFIATGQPITLAGGAPVLGVAMVDASGDPAAPWPITALDARAPTTAVAAALVRERVLDPTNAASPDIFQPIEQLRVYAALDSAACGPTFPIDCGVVTLDEHGLVPDPVGELPYRAPMPVTGQVTALAVGLPPASGASRITNDVNNPTIPVMTIAPASGVRFTSAVGAAASTQGWVYLLDLGRFTPLSDILALGTVGVTGARSTTPADVALPGSGNFGKTTALGLWTDVPPGVTSAAPSVDGDPATMPFFIQVTPGYTPNDIWSVSWQGALPQLAARRAVVGRAASGDVYVALQANAGTAAQPLWTAVARVGEPELGVRPGDVIEVTPDDPATCPPAPGGLPFPEPTVATDAPLLPPDPLLFPGGALRLAAGSCFAAGLAPGQAATATVTVRAAGLVLTNAATGYLGRPELDTVFSLQYADERTLTGEALAVARKVRRKFYPPDPPCTVPLATPVAGAPPLAGCYGLYRWIADPLAPGPAVAMRVGLLVPGETAGTPAPDPRDPAVIASIARGASIVFTTSSVLAPAYRRPIFGGALPTGVLAYDKTKFAGHADEPMRFFAPYWDDQVLDFTPSSPGVNGGSIR